MRDHSEWMADNFRRVQEPLLTAAKGELMRDYDSWLTEGNWYKCPKCGRKWCEADGGCECEEEEDFDEEEEGEDQ